MKKCRVCGQEKAETDFGLRSPDKNGKQYMRSDCKDCCKNALKAFSVEYEKTDRAKQARADYQRRYMQRMRELAEIGKQAVEARKA